MNWQPIETAPKDGTRVLGYGMMPYEKEPGIGTIAWDLDYKQWQCEPTEASEYLPEKCDVTHWMPLPEPPEVATKTRT